MAVEMSWETSCMRVCMYYENPVIAFLSGNFFSFSLLLQLDQSSTVGTDFYLSQISQNKALASKSKWFFSSSPLPASGSVSWFSIYLSFSEHYKSFYKFVCYFSGSSLAFAMISLYLHFFSIGLLSSSAHCISHKWAHIHELFISSLGHYAPKEQTPWKYFGGGFSREKIYSLIYLFLFTLLPLKRAICLRCHHCFFHFRSGQLHFAKGTWFRLFLALLWFMENAYYHKIRM